MVKELDVKSDDEVTILLDSDDDVLTVTYAGECSAKREDVSLVVRIEGDSKDTEDE